MRFGLDISQHQLTWEELLSRARFAEDLGFDGAWVFDHFKPLYGQRSGPCMEGWSLLAALAASTDRIRLGALVTGVTYRHPSILAAEAATVDNISKGRLEFAIGAAWHERGTSRARGRLPSDARTDRAVGGSGPGHAGPLDRGRRLFDGRYYSLNGASLQPEARAATSPADLDRRQRREEDDPIRRPVRRRVARVRGRLPR